MAHPPLGPQQAPVVVPPQVTLLHVVLSPW